MPKIRRASPYPESFAIQTISIMPPANATAAQLKDANKRAEDAYKQAKATKNAQEFGLLAEKISEDDYRVMMGDHKWTPTGKMPPEMFTARVEDEGWTDQRFASGRPSSM